MGVSFAIAAGPRQRSHSQVSVRRDSWPHFTVSDSRLPNLTGRVPAFISPMNKVAQLWPQAMGSLFFASYDSQGYGEGVQPCLHTAFWTGQSESESYITTDGKSTSLSWNKAPVWGLRPDLYYCQTVAGLLLWGALSDERTGLSFTIAPGPRQRSHLRVRILWDS
jgi:hypothetical protein